jgi:salicylate hydroxylase
VPTGNVSVLPSNKELHIVELICFKSVIKAAYGDPDTLRQAIFKMFRIIIPIEKIIEDEITRPLLSFTRNKFTMFADETRTMSWFEGHG